MAGITLGVVLGFALAELSDFLRRRRETAAAAVLVFQELVSAYSDALGVREGLVERPEEIYVRRTAWEHHGIAIARALALEDSHRIARAYSALDDLDRVLHAGAPAEAFARPEEQQWLDSNVIDQVLAAIRVVARLTRLNEETIEARIAETRPPV